VDPDWESEIARRKRLRMEEQADVEARGWRVDLDSGARVIRYRERGLVSRKDAPIAAMAGEIFHLPIELAVDLEAEAYVLRPWAAWPAEDEDWKPRFETALEKRRERIVERAAAWLRERGHDVRIEAELPDAGRPMRIPVADMTAMRTLLAFLLRVGVPLRGDTWTGHPNALFVGSKARRKWYATQGGEWNADVAGAIPVERVRRSFVLPRSKEEAIDVGADRISGAGPSLWQATIWAHPPRDPR
jgi:hypothetical protein